MEMFGGCQLFWIGGTFTEFASIGSTHIVLPCVIAVPTAMLLTVLRQWRQRDGSAKPVRMLMIGRVSV